MSRIIDQIKRISYSRFYKMGYRIERSKGSSRTINDNNYDDSYYNYDAYDYQRQTYAYSSACEFFLCNYNPEELKKISKTDLTVKSTDKKKETILHYILRNYFIFPDIKDKCEIGFYPTKYCTSQEREKRWSIEEFEAYKKSQFSNFLKDIRKNQEIFSILKDILKNLDSSTLMSILSVQDADGNTPLHVATFASLENLPRLISVLDCVAELTEDQRKTLLRIKNKKKESFLCYLAERKDSKYFEAIQKAFGNKLIQEEICSKSNRFFHRLMGNEYLLVFSILDNLYHKSLDEEKESKASWMAEQFLLKDSSGRNCLHLACREARRNSNSKPSLASQNQKLVNQLCTMLEASSAGEAKGLSYLEEAMISTTAKGWNPLHYICRSNDGEENIIRLLKNLQPKVIYQVLTNKTVKGKTPVHFVCEYGNKFMYDTLIREFERTSPGAAYYFLKKHETELKAVISKNERNTSLSVDEFNNTLALLSAKNKKLSELIDIYHYLEQYTKQSYFTPRAYYDRKNDFLKQLENYVETLKPNHTSEFKFKADTKFKATCYCCFYKGSQRYYKNMKNLAKDGSTISNETLQQFNQFLELQERNPLVEEILGKLALLPEVQAKEEASVSPSAPYDNAGPPAYSPC